jgi:hypothetical protein
MKKWRKIIERYKEKQGKKYPSYPTRNKKL